MFDSYWSGYVTQTTAVLYLDIVKLFFFVRVLLRHVVYALVFKCS